MKNVIPQITLPPDPTIVPKQKCRTCAYRTPSIGEELEMQIAYYVEQPYAHPCHERKGVFCLGAHEQVTEIERLVSLKLSPIKQRQPGMKEREMSEFKVGRRARLRGCKDKGVIVTTPAEHDKGFIGVRWDKGNGENGYYSHETLKLLKPKPAKAEKKAREWWIKPGVAQINGTGLSNISGPVVSPEKPIFNPQEFIHVRDVLPGSVQVMREELAKAWDDSLIYADGPKCQVNQFLYICKALGLKESAE